MSSRHGTASTSAPLITLTAPIELPWSWRSTLPPLGQAISQASKSGVRATSRQVRSSMSSAPGQWTAGTRRLATSRGSTLAGRHDELPAPARGVGCHRAGERMRRGYGINLSKSIVFRGFRFLPGRDRTGQDHGDAFPRMAGDRQPAERRSGMKVMGATRRADSRITADSGDVRHTTWNQRVRSLLLGPHGGGTMRRRASDAVRVGLAAVLVVICVPLAVHPRPAVIALQFPGATMSDAVTSRSMPGGWLP